MPYLRLLRPHQWVKNVFVFAALIFGQRVDELQSVLAALMGFALLCAASSTVYIINDIHDRAEDRLHPTKRKRPLAAGEVSVGSAILLALALLAVSLVGGWWLSRGFGIVVAAYLLLQFGYTFALKNIVILDVISIGSGFVLRAIAGAALLDVEISHWLILCTFTLCLFMGFSKRRSELTSLRGANGEGAELHRKTLALYTPDLLNHMTTLTAGIAIVAFMLYTVDPRTVEVFGTNYLLYTLPIVVYAVFRFALLVEHGEVEGPTDVVLKDRPFQAAIVVWLIAALLIVYRGREIRTFLTDLVSGG